ncbi:MAG: Fe-S cluster assembly protein SufD [Actinomycetota bacterium]|nr:Fe-S cluster assembly protein SufD [Actinomycetota bacterium]
MAENQLALRDLQSAHMELFSDIAEAQKSDRRRAQELLAQKPLPSATEEEWRYSRIDSLLAEVGSFEVSGAAVADSSRGPSIDGEFSGRITLTDGRIWFEGAEGIRIEQVDSSKEQSTFSIDSNDDYFRLFARGYAPVAVRVTVEEGYQLQDPILLEVELNAATTLVAPRFEFIFERGSSASVIEVVTGGGAASLLTPLVEVAVRSDAICTYSYLQNCDANASIVENVVIEADRASRVTYSAFGFGADYGRLRFDGRIIGDDVDMKVRACYFGSDKQMLDFRTFQRHIAPRSTSDLLFKGAVGNDAHSVYSGLVVIEEGAVKSDAYQTNRNLVLSPGARADSVPNLDIRENSVRCSHASAVGPIDPEMMFYLESRGVDPEEARRLIIEGFFKEITEAIPNLNLRAQIGALVANKLKGI